jgi:hypothetical protein
MDVATKKFNKNSKPASGKVEFTADKLAQDYIMSGGPLGIRGRGAKGEAGSKQMAPEKKNNDYGYGIRPASPVKADKDFVRKSKTKSTIKKVSANRNK